MNKISAVLASVSLKLIYIFLFGCNFGSAQAATKEYVGCNKVQIMCKELSEIIKNDNFKPDLLIGLSRGGLQPLGFLAGEKQLNIRNVATIALTSYNEMEQGHVKIVLPLHVEDYRNYKSILIVDDLVDSGKTMLFIKNLLETELPESEIKVAVLYYKATSKIKPDYYVQETDEWIVFPWEN